MLENGYRIGYNEICLITEKERRLRVQNESDWKCWQNFVAISTFHTPSLSLFLSVSLIHTPTEREGERDKERNTCVCGCINISVKIPFFHYSSNDSFNISNIFFWFSVCFRICDFLGLLRTFDNTSSHFQIRLSLQ